MNWDSRSYPHHPSYHGASLYDYVTPAPVGITYYGADNQQQSAQVSHLGNQIEALKKNCMQMESHAKALANRLKVLSVACDAKEKKLESMMERIESLEKLRNDDRLDFLELNGKELLLRSRVEDCEVNVQYLAKKLQETRDAMEYLPGGPEFLEARDHFYSALADGRKQQPGGDGSDAGGKQADGGVQGDQGAGWVDNECAPAEEPKREEKATEGGGEAVEEAAPRGDQGLP